MLIYIKSYITYLRFRLIGILYVICDIRPKPYDYQRVKRRKPIVTFDFIRDTPHRNVNRS